MATSPTRTDLNDTGVPSEQNGHDTLIHRRSRSGTETVTRNLSTIGSVPIGYVIVAVRLPRLGGSVAEAKLALGGVVAQVDLALGGAVAEPTSRSAA